MNSRPPADDASRRYHILGVLGRGGFGTVYKANLETGDGFVKQVAVKLLNGDDIPEEVLQRFRDEARILGLLRDRAIIGVDPPARLNDRWAVIMEYADGCSLARLLKSGAVPVEPALAITGELARALARFWVAPGPDGTPLNLLHRDIKPGNIQISPTGDVKLLDFGNSKAKFDRRESLTTSTLTGTTGYMAPERFAGEEGETVDVFSLGVMLNEMLTGRRAKPSELFSPSGDTDALDDPDAPVEDRARALAVRMVQLEADERPVPAEVERWCNELAPRGSYAIRKWAGHAVGAAQSLPADALVGDVLSETMSQRHSMPMATNAPGAPDRGNDSRTALLIGAFVGVGLVALGLGLATLGTSGFAWMLYSEGKQPVSAQIVDPPELPGSRSATTPDADGVVAVEDPPAAEDLAGDEASDEDDADDAENDAGDTEEDADAEQPDPVVDTEPSAPTPSPEPAPVPAPVKQPVPQPVAPPAPVKPPPSPAPAPAPAGPTETLRITSVPPDAQVTVDGVEVGTTPLMSLDLTRGRHVLKLTADGQEVTTELHVGRRTPRTWIWRVGEATMEAR